MADDVNHQEQALIKRALDDPAAFQQLYNRYFKSIYGYVASRISNQHDAEDTVSEIFLRVIRYLPQLRNQYPASFAAWLFTIARHAVTDHYRHKEATEVIPLETALPDLDVKLDPDLALIAGEDSAQVRQLIACLPERKREVVTLKYYGGLRNQEIAVVLQIGEKTVAAYLSRALAELHDQYMNLKAQAEQKEVNHDSR